MRPDELLNRRGYTYNRKAHTTRTQTRHQRGELLGGFFDEPRKVGSVSFSRKKINILPLMWQPLLWTHHDHWSFANETNLSNYFSGESSQYYTNINIYTF